MHQEKKKDFDHVVIGWDILNWQPVLAFWRSALRDVEKGKALELGCGPGGISMWLCDQGFSVCCSDIEMPGDKVRNMHKKYGFTDIEYQAVDALDIRFDEEFDVVVFKSVAGGVSRNGQDSNRDVMMQQIHKCLKPGGVLIFAENLSASPIHRFFRKNFVKWGSSWNYPTLNQMLTSQQCFDKVAYRVRGFAGAFGRTESQRSLFSYFDKFFFDPLLPQSWKYIMYGIARKAKG